MAKKEKPEPKVKKDPKCKNCGFKLRNLCRRFPPKSDSSSREGFPRVKDEDWCGEHKFVKETTPEPEPEPE